MAIIEVGKMLSFLIFTSPLVSGFPTTRTLPKFPSIDGPVFVQFKRPERRTIGRVHYQSHRDVFDWSGKCSSILIQGDYHIVCFCLGRRSGEDHNHRHRLTSILIRSVDRWNRCTDGSSTKTLNHPTLTMFFFVYFRFGRYEMDSWHSETPTTTPTTVSQATCCIRGKTSSFSFQIDRVCGVGWGGVPVCGGQEEEEKRKNDRPYDHVMCARVVKGQSEWSCAKGFGTELISIMGRHWSRKRTGRRIHNFLSNMRKSIFSSFDLGHCGPCIL